MSSQHPFPWLHGGPSYGSATLGLSLHLLTCIWVPSASGPLPSPADVYWVPSASGPLHYSASGVAVNLCVQDLFACLFSILFGTDLRAELLGHMVVQSLGCGQLLSTPWTVALQASLSFTISWSLLRLMSFELMMITG